MAQVVFPNSDWGLLREGSFSIKVYLENESDNLSTAEMDPEPMLLESKATRGRMEDAVSPGGRSGESVARAGSSQRRCSRKTTPSADASMSRPATPVRRSRDESLPSSPSGVDPTDDEVFQDASRRRLGLPDAPAMPVEFVQELGVIGEQSVSPEGLNQSAVPLGLNQDFVPLGLNQIVAPLGLNQNFVPLGLNQNFVPLGLNQIVAPPGLNQNDVSVPEQVPIFRGAGFGPIGGPGLMDAEARLLHVINMDAFAGTTGGVWTRRRRSGGGRRGSVSPVDRRSWSR